MRTYLLLLALSWSASLRAEPIAYVYTDLILNGDGSLTYRRPRRVTEVGTRALETPDDAIQLCAQTGGAALEVMARESLFGNVELKSVRCGLQHAPGLGGNVGDTFVDRAR